MDLLRKKANSFIYKTFLSDYKEDDNLSFFGKGFERIVDRAYFDIIKEKNPSKTPFLIRIGGQSGSGKTTQLMPAIKNFLDENSISYIHLAVRIFAEYHPYYEEITKNFDKSLWREKTNGFALSLLFAVFERLIENNYNVFFEVTLLEPDFEEYIAVLAKNKGYKINYNIFSIPQDISNSWILERQISKGVEANRIVLKTSSDYFYSILPKAIDKIINLNVFDKNDWFILWSAFSKNPIFVSNKFSIDILIIFEEYRKSNIYEKNNIEDLLNSKKVFYKEFLLNFLN